MHSSTPRDSRQHREQKTGSTISTPSSPFHRDTHHRHVRSRDQRLRVITAEVPALLQHAANQPSSVHAHALTAGGDTHRCSLGHVRCARASRRWIRRDIARPSLAVPRGCRRSVSLYITPAAACIPCCGLPLPWPWGRWGGAPPLLPAFPPPPDPAGGFPCPWRSCSYLSAPQHGEMIRTCPP